MADPTPLPVPLRPRQIARFGWRMPNPDFRDLRYTPQTAARQLPASVDLRAGCPSAFDQGQLGACTSHAIAAMVMFEQQREGIPVFVLSRLAHYYWERMFEGTTQVDAGASLRDGLRVVNRIGMAFEFTWPYDPNRFRLRPPPSVQRQAALHTVTQYMAVSQTLDAMRGCLADGHVFVTGISVFDSFERADVLKTGDVPMPSASESMLGGHAITICGYDDNAQRFRWLNSWGPSYGQNGFGTLPYGYLANPRLAGDTWAVKVCN